MGWKLVIKSYEKIKYTMLGEGYEKYLKDTQGEPMDKIKDYSKVIRYFQP